MKIVNDIDEATYNGLLGGQTVQSDTIFYIPSKNGVVNITAVNHRAFGYLATPYPNITAILLGEGITELGYQSINNIKYDATAPTTKPKLVLPKSLSILYPNAFNNIHIFSVKLSDYNY